MFSYPSNMTQPTYNATNNTNSSNIWNYTILTDNTTNMLLGKTSEIPSPQISSIVTSIYLQTGYDQLYRISHQLLILIEFKSTSTNTSLITPM